MRGVRLSIRAVGINKTLKPRPVPMQPNHIGQRCIKALSFKKLPAHTPKHIDITGLRNHAQTTKFRHNPESIYGHPHNRRRGRRYANTDSPSPMPSHHHCGRCRSNEHRQHSHRSDHLGNVVTNWSRQDRHETRRTHCSCIVSVATHSSDPICKCERQHRDCRDHRFLVSHPVRDDPQIKHVEQHRCETRNSLPWPFINRCHEGVHGKTRKRKPEHKLSSLCYDGRHPQSL